MDIKSVRFIRAISIVNLYFNAKQMYGLDSEQLVIPHSVFKQPMNLIPLSEVNRMYAQLEQVTEPDFILNLTSGVDIAKFGAVGRWLFSGHDLSTTIRRINYGVSCLQSGAFLAGAQIGAILKWTYDNPFIHSDVKVHDSIRIAVFMTKVLREYLGEDFCPKRVMISGSRQNRQRYQDFFGCEIGWNHKRTEVWIHSDERLAVRQKKTIANKRLAMNFADLDDLLNMPVPDDELKSIYELVNYSCHYGLPTLNRVAELISMSEQQLQRRLHALGLNFSTVCGYVLSNQAVNALTQGVTIEDVSRRLGYTNIASFNRMFKKHRGVTPKEYLQRFHDVY
ncbi:helix-turn-helix domain-containing protein [Vibrio vulnificus]|nr:helix-turn-helix domain-containing protein [Vibrio vulnificus]MCU8459174.1 helix-turn-helix domain-containing protein [Vibrio vulnificus]